MPRKKKAPAPVPVGKKIKKARTSKKLTLDHVANETGFSIDYLKEIEAAKAMPPVGALLQIARALEIDSGSKRMLATKPIYGGNAQAVYTSDSDPQIATVRAKVMAALEPDASRKGEVITVESGLDSSAIRTKVLEEVKEEIEGIKLEDATVVVSGGRGIGGPEGFQQLAELAKLLKGAVGASRPACDSGWMPDTAQVGLTGKIVTPDFYLAVGISGSSQHMAGCSSSKCIVAINKDPEANIFKEARYGVVGDWKKVLPTFIQKVKELLAP